MNRFTGTLLFALFITLFSNIRMVDGQFFMSSPSAMLFTFLVNWAIFALIAWIFSLVIKSFKKSSPTAGTIYNKDE